MFSGQIDSLYEEELVVVHDHLSVYFVITSNGSCLFQFPLLFLKYKSNSINEVLFVFWQLKNNVYQVFVSIFQPQTFSIWIYFQYCYYSQCIF
jgi:hypothetical protein